MLIVAQKFKTDPSILSEVIIETAIFAIIVNNTVFPIVAAAPPKLFTLSQFKGSPSHIYPGSILHLSDHPSLFITFPSSQTSVPEMRPSPQTSFTFCVLLLIIPCAF